MKNITRWLLIILLTIGYFPTLQAKGQVQNALKWSPVFRSSEIVDIVVQGWEDPWFGSLEKEKDPLLQTQYVRTLSSWQNQFITQYRELPSFKVMDTYQLSYNGIWIQIRGYEVPMLAKSGLARKIHLIEEKVFPTRDMVRGSIQMPFYTEVTEAGDYPDGSGTVIGIVDTGIFYNHEDFWPEGMEEEPGFPNVKVIGGYDFADKDEDPVDDRNGHGTHVAGIAAGNHQKNPANQGIAPKAALISYKVFSSKVSGGAPATTIVSAAESALKDHCTVINLSLGHNGETHSTYDDAPYFSALDNAVKGGVVVVAAAGNDGSRIEGNPWPIHAPGVFLNMIQVAASDDRGIQPIELQYPSSWSRTVLANLARHTPPFAEELSGLEIVDVGYGRKSDFTEADVKGKIALISRGPKEEPITFQEKNLNAKENGAKACIIYNYDPGSFRGTMITATEEPSDFEFIPTLMVSGVIADQIRFCQQYNGSLQFQKPSPPIISDYTSAGPCLDGDLGVFKPEVCAPGTYIRSSIPANNAEKTKLISAWTDLSGTSMASPVVTGAVALMKQAHPEWTPEQIKCILMNTADLLINPINQEIFSFNYQGSGQINVHQALNTHAIISPPSVMRCSGTIGEKSTLSIQNITDQPLSVEVRSVFFSTGASTIELITDKPYITIPPESKETLEFWFHSESEKIEWSRLEGVIWFQVSQQNVQEESFQSLHVPIVLYSETTETIAKPLSNVSVSNAKLDRKDHPIVTIRYALNTGTVVKTTTEVPGEKEGEIKKVQSISARNYASILQMQLYNEKNEQVYAQILGEKFPVGQYEFAWDGKALEGMDVLPDGTYTLYIGIQSWDLYYNKDQKLISQTEYWEKSNPVILEMKNSQTSVQPSFLIALPDQVSAYSLQGVSFYLEKAEEIDEVKVTVHYDPSLLSPIRSEVQSFSLNEAAGEFSWSIKRDFAVKSRFFLGEHLFQWAKPGKNPIQEVVTELYFRGILLRREVQVMNPSVEIVEGPACLGDFNQDQVIDEADFLLWQPHYGTTWRSIGWNPDYDLNHDWVINAEDLLLLSRCYTKNR